MVLVILFVFVIPLAAVTGLAAIVRMARAGEITASASVGWTTAGWSGSGSMGSFPVFAG